jgi:hypothetical protein
MGAKTRGRRKSEKLSEPEAAAQDVEKQAPRLIKVAARTTISFGLLDGANRALLDGLSEDARQVALGYRGDALLMTVVRLVLLLDNDPKVVSFQSMYRHLRRPEVLDALVQRGCSESTLAEILSDRVERDIRDSVGRFLAAYRAIDWSDVHGRLQHFRNRGVAHLAPEEIEKRVTYGEIESLVRSISLLAESLLPFYPNGVAVHVDEIEEWSDRAKMVWDAMLRGLEK